MAFAYAPMAPGLLFDAAERYAADAASPKSAGAPSTGSAGVASTGATAAATAAAPDVIAAMGWALALIPETMGGLGGSLAELAGLVEGLAVHGNPLPVIERVAIAPTLLLAATGGSGAAAGATAGRRPAGAVGTPIDGVVGDLVGGLVDGRLRIAPLIGPAGLFGPSPIVASAQASGLRLDGIVRGVDAVSSPTHWVVPVRLGDGEAIVVVDGAAAQDAGPGWRTMDGRPSRDLRLAGVVVQAASIVARGDDARRARERAGDRALALIGVDSAAVLGTLVARTIDHLNGRVQFGVPLASFQALRHQLVDVYIRFESARGMVGQLIAEADAVGRIDRRRARLTKLAIGEGARASAETVIQLHGGMGMSEETAAARLAQRLLANEFRHGDRLAHSAALPLRPQAGRAAGGDRPDLP